MIVNICKMYEYEIKIKYAAKQRVERVANVGPFLNF